MAKREVPYPQLPNREEDKQIELPTITQQFNELKEQIKQLRVDIKKILSLLEVFSLLGEEDKAFEEAREEKE